MRCSLAGGGVGTVGSGNDAPSVFKDAALRMPTTDDQAHAAVQTLSARLGT